MELRAALYDIDLPEPTVLLHEDDCRMIGVKDGDRVRIASASVVIAITTVSDTLVDMGTVLLPPSVMRACGASPGDSVEVSMSHAPDSVRAIRRKMDGEVLSPEEIEGVVADTMSGRLSRIEIAAWLTALHIKGMNIHETAAYAKAMACSGGRLDFGDRRVFDFHSFGGLPGNKITPVVVSIVAAAGLVVPKLSSRAISSACGTADFVETFCRIDLGSDDVKRISEDAGGVFSWTGATDLGPAGDRFITVQRPLGIDPKPQMLASIMSKKMAAGATDLVIDIPTGDESKVKTLEAAKTYAKDLMVLGEELGIRVECAITYADQPLGEAVGPVLEARECMQVLEGVPGHADVAEKSCICAGMLLEMGGSRDGAAEARQILESGRALEKFREIVLAQGGDPQVSSESMVPGGFTRNVVSDRSGFVRGISNKAIVAIAKAAGAPSDKGAGIIILKKRGMKVVKGDPLIAVYADREDKLIHALEVAADSNPVDVDGMLLDTVRPGNGSRKSCD